jgi:spore coat polysaccharide biosynthesis protein SpsF
MTTSIGTLITVRLKSTRLPKKAIKPIKGKPMLVHMIDRLKLVDQSDGIVLCTSPVDEDDPIEEIANQEGVECYRGDPDDVLGRLTSAAQQYDLDTVISITADCPFCDPEYADKVVDYHLEHGYDFMEIEGLPYGTFSYALQREAMEKATEIAAKKDTEVWGGYFKDTGLFDCGTLKVTDDELNWPDLRLTVDYPADFELVSRIFDELYTPDEVFSLKEIVNLCREKSELPAINAECELKTPPPISVDIDE